MDKLEKQLAQALKHEDPPADFTAKVMARVAKESKPVTWLQFLWLPAQRAALAGGLAAVMLVAASGGVIYHQRQAAERRRAEAARDQLLTALRITGTQLNRVSRVISTPDPETRLEKE